MNCLHCFILASRLKVFFRFYLAFAQRPDRQLLFAHRDCVTERQVPTDQIVVDLLPLIKEREWRHVQFPDLFQAREDTFRISPVLQTTSDISMTASLSGARWSRCEQKFRRGMAS